jgi:hypothetical protein
MDEAMTLRGALELLIEETRHVANASREGGDTESADVLDTARECAMAALDSGEDRPNLNNIYDRGLNIGHPDA